MKSLYESIPVKQSRLTSIKPAWFLFTGIITMSVSHLTLNVDMLAWVAMVPFLIYLKMTQGWKSRMLFSFIILITWSLIISKITTDPIPFMLIPLYSIPITLFHLPGYLLFGARIHDKWSIFLFPTVMIVSEWIQYSFTPFGSWGVSAYTQANSLPILQSLSLFGLAGLSFLIYWSNATIAELLILGRWEHRMWIPAISVAAILIFGSIRIDMSKLRARETITVAAIGTDSDISGPPLPSWSDNEKIIQKIFDRTSKAAAGGAKMVVWNEAAFFLEQESEQAWLDTISLLAQKKQISIVASYVVPLSASTFRYENKFNFFKPDGTIAIEYLKHEPVPGEPAVKGSGEQRIIAVEGSNIGGAICYDYDFPYLARGNMKAGADIVVLPSSDWRGIDPLHTQMAAFRAIEQGHSILRSTRFGLSAAITPYGEMASVMSSFDHHEKIMMALLPVRGIQTLYSIVGDMIVYLSIIYLLIIAVLSVLRNNQNAA